MSKQSSETKTLCDDCIHTSGCIHLFHNSVYERCGFFSKKPADRKPYTKPAIAKEEPIGLTDKELWIATLKVKQFEELLEKLDSMPAPELNAYGVEHGVHLGKLRVADQIRAILEGKQ